VPTKLLNFAGIGVETERAIILLAYIHNAVVEDFTFVSLFLRLPVSRTAQNKCSPSRTEIKDLFASWKV
jgi:endonuclease III-like uncharacterized protein